MTNPELPAENSQDFNVFLLVIFSSVSLILLNIFFYQLKGKINYFELSANTILLMTTFYLIYVTQRNSTNKSGFYYYTSFGFAFLFFGLLILTLDYVFVYPIDAVKISVKLLFVFGYSLLAIGVTKWVKYNENKQDELTIQANTDVLTGLLNRRSFTRFIAFHFHKAKTRLQPFSLIILDVDHFKKVNDTHGHLVGDEILKSLATIMNSFFRDEDKVCRWGGEEFAILLPNTSLKNAETVAEKIRKKIEVSVYLSGDLVVKSTVSLGVSEWLSSDVTVDKIINRSDKALYLAKEECRNCVRSIGI